MSWPVNDPARFVRERDEIAELEAKEGWIKATLGMGAHGLVIVNFDMTIHGRSYVGTMTYPDTFPATPPYIRPDDPTERWSNHQYGEGGSLCLEWRSDNWQPHVSGADILKSAYSLLLTEGNPESPRAVLSAHKTTPGQEMRSTFFRFVVTNELSQIIQAMPDQGMYAVKCRRLIHASCCVSFITEIADAAGEWRRLEDVPTGISDGHHIFSVEAAGHIFKHPAFKDLGAPASRDDLHKALELAGFPIASFFNEEEKSKSEGYLLCSDAHSAYFFRAFTYQDEPERILAHHAVYSGQPGVRSKLDEQKILNSIRVAVIGLGSMGSKVAVSLARAGVKKFLLVDDDYIQPENMVRHELSWLYVGVNKVNAIEEDLALIAPGIEVATSTNRLAAQESPRNISLLLKKIAACDLLIDATANTDVFNLLAQLADGHKKPLFWAEVFAGGYGGMIARATPDWDPNPLAVRDSIHEYLATLPEAPYKRAQGYDADGDAPLIAYDSDVTHIASALTRLVLDAVLKEMPKDFPSPAYLIGLKQEWVFRQAFDVHPVTASGAGWAQANGPIREEDLKSVLQFFATNSGNNADAYNQSSQ
ncbi:ThiF family adenylyltransferase [Herbaspirillum seropedicae]|uniref:ThiF family adenylyltransferase n=1 Tax=Herbaspirillum seropedicae TaxID=964 RepID=UPI003D978CAA